MMFKLAKIFQDDMILQREKPIRVWGESDEQQTLAISIDGSRVAEETITAGKFSLTLPAQKAAENVTLTVKSSAGDDCSLRNVDIGEIWIAGGQSNMAFFLRDDAEGMKTIAQANDEHLRYYDVAKYAFEGEEADGFKDASRWDRWFPYKRE